MYNFSTTFKNIKEKLIKSKIILETDKDEEQLYQEIIQLDNYIIEKTEINKKRNLLFFLFRFTNDVTIEYLSIREKVESNSCWNFAGWLYGDDKLIEGRKDFYNWFNTLDTRRGTDFLKTFPEMTNFYNRCKDLNDD